METNGNDIGGVNNAAEPRHSDEYRENGQNGSNASTLELQLMAAQEQLAAANATAKENHDKFLLARADFDNFKKRTERDSLAIFNAYRKSLLERFLPVIDNLERALQVEGAPDGLRNGVEQTLKGFEAVLSGEGVKPIDVLGKPFDPRIAEAIGTTEPSGDAPDDTIVQVAQKGYTMGEDILRPAKVIVSKKAG